METAFQKLRNRTEWQAYLISLIVLFINHFFELEIDSETLWQMVGLSGAYGASRGLAKFHVGVAHANPVPAKNVEQPAKEEPAPQAGAKESEDESGV